MISQNKRAIFFHLGVKKMSFSLGLALIFFLILAIFRPRHIKLLY